MTPRILIAEDEKDIARVVADLLESAGYHISLSADGPGTLDLALRERFDLIILDLMLPGMNGTEVCRRLRAHGYEGGILMLTALSRTSDQVQGLRSGADDYVTKPFVPEALAARVAAMLRRLHRDTPAAADGIEFGNVRADFIGRVFSLDGKPLALSSKEAELLRLLVSHRGTTLTREFILQQVWNDQPFITARTVDTHVAWLRKKIEPSAGEPRYILTERGEGYRFETGQARATG